MNNPPLTWNSERKQQTHHVLIMTREKKTSTISNRQTPCIKTEQNPDYMLSVTLEYDLNKSENNHHQYWGSLLYGKSDFEMNKNQVLLKAWCLDISTPTLLSYDLYFQKFSETTAIINLLCLLTLFYFRKSLSMPTKILEIIHLVLYYILGIILCS